MLNPSVQHENIVMRDDRRVIYSEAVAMYEIAAMVREELKSAGGVEAFISRDSADHRTTLRDETARARELGCDVLVALHSDAAADGEPGGGTWAFHSEDPESRRLAECVEMSLLEGIRSFHPVVEFRGVREHWKRLWVLHESGCPAALIEILFHSDPTERAMLLDTNCREIIADSIARGILSYFNPIADDRQLLTEVPRL